jgi:ubiquitin carboxyl-terminal hydrolase 25/28
VDELHSLFEELRTASTKSVKPTKALAELTIFSTNATLAWERKKSISSPSAPNLSLIMNTDAAIESRFPSPPPSSHPSVILVEEDVEMIDHPGNKISDGEDDSSEATLVDATTRPFTPPPSYDHVTGDMNNDLSIIETSQQASLNGQGGIIDNDNDAVMVNGGNHITISVPDKPPPVPPRNKSGLSIQTTSKEIISEDELWKFGSQQDVTEIISNVLHRLRSAIKANSIDEISGDQIDNIRDVFYGATSTSTQKARALERKIETWAEIIAFPPLTGSHDIYEALDVSFDVQQVYVEDSLTPQYTSIHKLPPILQIQIQRTAYDQVNSVPFKNKNPVTFPETIYLDRYMDSDDPKTMRRREEAWEWKAQIRALEARQKVLKATEADITLPDALYAAKDFINQIQENEIDGIEIDPALPEALDDRFSEVKVELDKIEAEIANLKHRLAKQFVDMRQHEYNLQTVFIHRGESGGGHYWIYIYDFKNDIWREYNDERVTEVVDRKRIFEHSSQAGGTPYYLAYVRAADKDDLVDAVYRDVKEVEMTDVTGAWVDGTDGVEDEGIGMDEEEEGGTRHIEHARPRPLLPKPTVAQNAAAGGAWTQDWDSITPSRVDANGKPWS